MKARLLLCAVVAAAACAANAAMYKWVDEKGVTHYSETPPPDRKAKEVDIRVTPSTAPADSPERWKARELEFRKRQLGGDEAAKAEERTAAERKQRCDAAQRRLALLQQPIRIFSTNDKGERVYLEDNDRAAEIETLHRRIDDNCR